MIQSKIFARVLFLVDVLHILIHAENFIEYMTNKEEKNLTDL